MPDTAEQLRAELQKLGSNGPARVQAVEQYVRATAGNGAQDIIANLRTAAAVEGFERLMANTRTATATASTPPPSPGRDGRVDEATFQKMTAAERLDYCRQFPQTG
jgi:hypothetical protein